MNTRTRFLFKELDIRGQHLSMSEAWQAMIENRSYSRQVRQLLGELSALAIMLTSGMKHKGKLTLQLQGDGVVSLMSEKELTKITMLIKPKKGLLLGTFIRALLFLISSGSASSTLTSSFNLLILIFMYIFLLL
jgi:hypothetical protein